MKDYYAENAMKTMAAYCTEEGIVIVEDLAQNQIIYKIDIFGDRYKYLQYEWDITPYFSFSPDDKLLVTGVFGGPVKVFELISGKESASFEMLEWVSAPLDIDNRKLVVFLNDKEFVFVNKERELVWAISDETGSWDVKTKIAAKELVAFGNNIFDIEYDRTQKSISCYGGRKGEGCVIAL